MLCVEIACAARRTRHRRRYRRQHEHVLGLLDRARLAVIASRACEIRSSSRRLRALSPGSLGPLAPSSGQLLGCLRGGAARARKTPLPGSGAMDNAAYTRRHGPPTGKPAGFCWPGRSRARPRRHRTRQAFKQSDKGSSQSSNVAQPRDAAPECDPRYPGRSATSVTAPNR